VQAHQRRHTTQIADGGTQRKEQIDFATTTQLHLPEDAVLLGVAEDRFDELARILAEPVAG
jgi:hypothetical protein